MANEFIIKKGHSSRLFEIPQEQLIENGWYLTLDTAEVYVALRQDSGLLELKKINECNTDTDFENLESFEERLTALEAERTHIYGYRSGFPAVGERDHVYVAEDEHRTYIYADNRYIHIADKFDSEDHDNNPETPEVRIIYGGSAN
jgi:hypothetical protein